MRPTLKPIATLFIDLLTVFDAVLLFLFSAFSFLLTTVSIIMILLWFFITGLNRLNVSLRQFITKLIASGQVVPKQYRR
jgi:hypothetical protein